MKVFFFAINQLDQHAFSIFAATKTQCLTRMTNKVHQMAKHLEELLYQSASSLDVAMTERPPISTHIPEILI
jgi:hypothetical protein